jgi:hypothetical protein
METRTQVIGHNGVKVNIIHCYTTPLESILNIGEAMRTKRRIKEALNRKATKKEVESMKRMVAELEANFSIKRNDDTNK